MNNSEKQAFLSAIANDRYDEVTRKVYADWLSENGFDEEAMEQYTWTREKQQAIDWLTELASEAATNYHYLVKCAKKFIDTSEKTNDSDLANYFQGEDMVKFWECISLVLGKKVLIQLNDSCFYAEFDEDDRYNCGCGDYDDGYESCAC